jgi:hypothetical protein
MGAAMSVDTAFRDLWRNDPSPDRTLDRIAIAFSDAVEAEEFDRATGWLAVARWHVARTADRVADST